MPPTPTRHMPKSRAASTLSKETSRNTEGRILFAKLRCSCRGTPNQREMFRDGRGGGIAESAILQVRLRKKSEREMAKGKAGKTLKECLKGLGLWRARGVWGGETFTLSSPGCLAPVGSWLCEGGGLSGIQPPSQHLPFPHSMAEQLPDPAARLSHLSMATTSSSSLPPPQLRH